MTSRVAASLIAEVDAVCGVTGACIPPYAALMLTAYRPREAEATQLIRATIDQATAAGQGAAVTWAHWAAMGLYVASEVRPGGTLLFLGGACSRRAATGIAFTAALTAALSAATRDLALEVAPVRVNLIMAGYAGTLAAGTRPAGRVVGPASIAALAVHLMTNTAITGATFDIDSDQRAVER